MPKLDKLYDRKPAKGNGKKGAPSAEDSAFIATARERAAEGATYWKDNWDAADDDLRFLAGEQWPSAVRTERELAQRPCLTNNVLPTFVDQVLGDQRQNKPAIKVSPVDKISVDVASGDEGETKNETLKISNVEGSKDYELGDVFTGLIKSIEYNSDAETAYDMAFQSAVQGAFGYLRILNDFEDEEGFEQELKIKHISNTFSVTMDPSAKEEDYSDMNWCFIDDLMPKDAFKSKYPDATPDPVSDTGGEDGNSWFQENAVRVSEYFCRKPVTRTMLLMSDGSTYYEDEVEKVVDELFEQGIRVVRHRKVRTFKVIWHKITGSEILEGPIELNCTTVPVAPVFGKSITIKNKKMFMSLIRHSKDAQRMANYWDSSATESVALAPKAPFIGMEGHTEGYEDEWENANTTNGAILTYVPQFQGDPGPRREQPASIPAAEITLAMNSSEKIKATMGMFDASLGSAGNETSGKAIVARQRQGDRGSFTFSDNLSKAIKRIGRLLVEMVPATYDTERVVRIKFPDDTEDFVQINKQVYDQESGEWFTIHDLGVVKYDVVVTTGPAYATQRMEAAESMIQFAQAVPAAAAAMADLIAVNMDWPGADTIAERLRKIIPPNLLSPEEREKIEEDAPQQTEPTPEQVLQGQELGARTAEAEAKTAQAGADVEKAQAEVVKAGATVAQAQADTLTAQLESAEAQAKLAVINDGAAGGDMALGYIRDVIGQVLAEMTAKQGEAAATQSA